MINSAKQNKRRQKEEKVKKRIGQRTGTIMACLRCGNGSQKQHNPTTCRQSSVTTTLILRIFDLFVCVLDGTPTPWWSCLNLFGNLA